MGFRGKAKFGVSVVYKGSVELRFTNLTEQEARETIRKLGCPNDITVSKPNRESLGSDTIEEAQKLANKLRGEIGFNLLEFSRTRRRGSTEYDRQIKTIRRALKKLCSTLSVRRGRGTAYAWVEIGGSGEFSEFTQEEKQALEKFGLNYGGNCAVISPEERKFWVKRAEEILEELIRNEHE